MLGSKSGNPPRHIARPAVETGLAVLAATLCWVDVRWALQAGLFPILDEVGTRALVLSASYGRILNFFPNTFYADRPLGWAFIKLMGDWFGFDYARQAACLMAIHFANCGMAFRLFRRLGVSVPVSIAGVGLFGGLWTTAQTATYLGEAFDVICLFFLLGSTLAMLSERRGASIVSAVLFLAALRSKEFAIVTPLLLTVLVALRLPRTGFRQTLGGIMRRLWLHYLILVIFGLRYAFLYRTYHALVTPGSPYRMDFHVATVLTSLSYYTGLIFGADGSQWQIPPALLGVVLAMILGWAFVRRRAGVAFGLAGYVLTALPVLLMPNTRAAYWVYTPQVFLILALCLIAEEVFVRPWKSAQQRWAAAVVVALVCLGWCVTFRRSSYFRDRIHWTLTVRRISARTAQEAAAQFPRMGAGTHVYINHSRDVTPWLFVAGPCSYFQIVSREKSITCVMNQPTDRLRALYASDPGPKYFVDYREDGSIVRSR